MTDLERLELLLRSIHVDDIWTPTELLDSIIAAVTECNNRAALNTVKNNSESEADRWMKASQP